MSDADVERVIETIRDVYGRWNRTTSVAQMREDWDTLFRPRAADWPIVAVDAEGVRGEWICAPEANPDHVILYLHGGGFRLGSIDSHRDLMQRLSRAAKARVFAAAYRRAPEHLFPAAHDDAFHAWRWLVGNVPDSARLAIAGDSAGGNLALATMVRARSAGIALPRAAYLMSPWTDLAATGASYTTHAARDPIHQRPMITGMAKGYLGATDPADPCASPLYADLQGLPPILIQTGDRETLVDDSLMFAEAARRAGVSVDVELAEGMIHVFPMFGELAEAQSAVERAGEFLKTRLTLSSR